MLVRIIIRWATIIIGSIIVSTFEAHAQTGIKDLYWTNYTRSNAAAQVMTSASRIGTSFRNDFCTKELMYKQLDYAWHKNQNILRVILSHYGYASFGELNVQVGYGRKFGDKISIALNGIYQLNHAKHYEQIHSFLLEVSLCYQITSKFNVAVNVHNPLRLKYGLIGEEVIPMHFDIHFGYFPNSKIGGYLFCQKRLPGNLDIGLGLIYAPNKNLIIDNECSLTAIGIGIHLPWKKLSFGIGTKWYYRIGISPECQIHYHF